MVDRGYGDGLCCDGLGAIPGYASKLEAAALVVRLEVDMIRACRLRAKCQMLEGVKRILGAGMINSIQFEAPSILLFASI